MALLYETGAMYIVQEYGCSSSKCSLVTPLVLKSYHLFLTQVAQSLPARAKPHYENVKPKLSRHNPVNEVSFTDGGPNGSSTSPTGGNSLTTDGVDDDFTCPGCKKKIKSENCKRHASSCEELITLVQDKDDSDVSGSMRYIDIPFDPNLVCPKCKKPFRVGEIQEYRKHFISCPKL